MNLKEGDVIQLGNHRLLYGDCTNKDLLDKLFNGDKATVIMADPPYGMGKEKKGVKNDNLYRDKLDEFQMQWYKAARLHVVDNGSVYIWGNTEGLWRLWYVGGLKDLERLTFRNQIIWDKQSGQGMLSEKHRMYPTGTEHCLFFMLGEQGFYSPYWDGWDKVRLYLVEEKNKSN